MTRPHSRSSSIVTKVINHFSFSVQHLRFNIAYRSEIKYFQRYDKQWIFSETSLLYGIIVICPFTTFKLHTLYNRYVIIEKHNFP